MNKLLGLGLFVYVLGDPNFSLFAGAGVRPEYVLSLMVALITVPWVTAQLED